MKLFFDVQNRATSDARHSAFSIMPSQDYPMPAKGRKEKDAGSITSHVNISDMQEISLVPRVHPQIVKNGRFWHKMQGVETPMKI